MKRIGRPRLKKQRPVMVFKFQPDVDNFIRRTAKQKRLTLVKFVTACVVSSGKDVEGAPTFNLNPM